VTDFDWAGGGWLGGVIEVPIDGTLALRGSSRSSRIDGGQLNLRGSGLCTNRVTVLLFRRAQFNNYGTFESTDDIAFDSANGPPAGTFNNYGTFIKSGGTTGMSFLTTLHTNRGTLRLERGRFNVGNGLNSGTIYISQTATQAFAGAPFVWEAGGQFTGPGLVHLVRGQFDPGTNDVVFPQVHFDMVEIRGTNNLTVSNGLWTFPIIGGGGKIIVPSGGTLTLQTGSPARIEDRLIVNHGTIRIGTNASVEFRTNAALLNRGVIELSRNSRLGNVDPPPVDRWFVNEGVLISPRDQSSRILLCFTNRGSIQVEGNLFIAGPAIQSEGMTQLQGGRLECFRPLDIRGGTLAGSGTIVATVDNRGILDPGGNLGQMNIQGPLTNLGVMLIRLDPALQDTQATRLYVDGPLYLDGVLRCALVDAARPTVGMNWRPMQFASSSGQFRRFEGMELTGGLSLQSQLGPTNLLISAVTGPVINNAIQWVPLSGSELELRFSGNPGSIYILESSTNLLNWEILASPSLSDGYLLYHDSETQMLPQRFYRIRTSN
jgi:hypothetical protein